MCFLRTVISCDIVSWNALDQKDANYQIHHLVSSLFSQVSNVWMEIFVYLKKWCTEHIEDNVIWWIIMIFYIAMAIQLEWKGWNDRDRK